ncbi:biotin/lipoyl-containing protein, partial [Arthrospira platensis SPKY2]
GFVQAGQWVEKGQVLASISDPYGKVEHKIKAPSKGILINVCQAPIVYQGDALFHLGTPK